jgi:hypothetical protein
MPNNQIKIGYIKSFAKKGDRVTVYFPNGKRDRFVAENDITSRDVVVIGDRAFSQDVGQEKLRITTRLFKSRNNYEEGSRYPYLSVFINQQEELVITYNGSQKILGDLLSFAIGAVNLNRFSLNTFTGTILSKNQTQVVSFNNQKIEPVRAVPILPQPWKYLTFLPNQGFSEYNVNLRRRLLGNKIYDYLEDVYGYVSRYQIKFLPVTVTTFHSPYLVPFGSRSGQYLDESTYRGYEEPLSSGIGYLSPTTTASVSFWRAPPLTNQFLMAAPETYTWSENRTITNYGTIPGSFSNAVANWSFELTGQVIALKSGENEFYPRYPSSQPPPPPPTPVTVNSSGNLTKDVTKELNSESSIAIEFPTVFDANGSVLENTRITYESNISESVECSSNFAITTESITAWQNTFFQFVGIFYVPYTSTSISYSGQANCNHVASKNILAEMLIPVPVCDRRIVNKKKYLQKEYSRTTSIDLTVSDSPIGTFYASSVPSPITQITSSQELINYENLDIGFIFNIGDLGIYREDQLVYSVTEDINGSMSNFESNGRLTATADVVQGESYENTYNQIELSAGKVTQFVSGTSPDLFNETVSRSIYNYSAYSIIKTENISANFSFYKIAYLDNEPITAYPGYAKPSFTATPSRVVDFYLNPIAANSTIELSASLNQRVDYVSKETRTTSKNAGQNSQGSVVYERQSLPQFEAENVDLTGEYVVYKQVYQNETYLALCRVESVNVSFQTNHGNTSNNFNQKYIDKVQCTLISVKKIKPFGFNENSGVGINEGFLFTVNGCAIFQFLDPYRTSLITIDNGNTGSDVYLAATMTGETTVYNPYSTRIPTVTEKDTQAMVFKLTPTGFSFVAVVEGDISDPSQEKSPDAAYWIKYWDRPPASFW